MEGSQEVITNEHVLARLSHATEMLTVAHRQAVECLGVISIVKTAGDQEFLNQLADVYESLQGLYEEGFLAINAVDNESPAEVEAVQEQPAAETIVLTDVEEQLVAFMNAHPGATVDEVAGALYGGSLDENGIAHLAASLDFLAANSFIVSTAVDETDATEVAQPTDSPPADQTTADQSTDLGETDAVFVELSQLEKAVLLYAQVNGRFRMETMRNKWPAIQDLTKEEYNELKKTFKVTQQRIVDSLGQQGIIAHWEEDGKARGKKYELIIDEMLEVTTEQPQSLEDAVDHPESPAQPEAEQPQQQLTYYDRLAQQTESEADKADQDMNEQEVRALTEHQRLVRGARFVDRFVDGVRQLEVNGGSTVKPGVRCKQLARDTAPILGITVAEAEQLINSVVAAGNMHKLPSREGHKIVSTYELTKDEQLAAQVSQIESLGRKPEALPFTDEEQRIVGKIVRGLAHEDVRLGIKLKSLWLSDPDQEEMARLVVARLAGAGLVERYQPKRQRATHSRRNTEPFVRMTSIDTWREAKKSVRSVIDTFVASSM